MSEDQFTVTFTPIERIHSDDDFNCRGVISSFEVTELAQDIAKQGLQFPIAVQPASDVEDGLPDGKDFRIIAGHRRFKAWSVLQRSHADDHPGEENPYDKIPMMTKTGLDELQARVMNLSENIKREDLDIVQEAHAIDHFRRAGWPRDHVAAEIGKSSGWVQTRYNLLELPQNVQDEVKAGFINQLQIKQLYSIRNDPDKLFEAVKTIKKAKMKGETAGHVGKRKKTPLDTKKERKRPEMFEMNKLIAAAMGYGLHTRILGWASGEVTTEELFDEIKNYCSNHNLDEPILPKEL